MLHKLPTVISRVIKGRIMPVRVVRNLKWSNRKKRPIYIGFILLIIISLISSILLPGVTTKAATTLTWSSNADFFKNKAGVCQFTSYSGLSISGGDYSDSSCADLGADSSLTLGQTTDKLRGVVSISSGTDSTFALKNDGTVMAWGVNGSASGYLGVGSTSASVTTPTQVSSLSGVTSIATGGGSTFALKNDGTVWAWGNNGSTFGYLGVGSTSASVTTPTQVSSLSNVTSIATGGGSTFALKNDGTVWAWGFNNYQMMGIYVLGLGSTSASVTTPTQISSLSGVTSIATGSGGSSFAIKNDGTVWAWGNNGSASGYLGVGSTYSFVTTPTQVSSLSGVTSIATGYNSTFALKNDGTVMAWGVNGSASGYLGVGSTSASVTTPTQVSSLSGVTSIATGGGSTFALKNDGTVWAWGFNGSASGYLGVGSTSASVTTPTQVSSLSNVTSIATGTYSTFALKNDGTVWAWGHNFSASGYLGVGSTSDSVTTPAQVIAPFVIFDNVSVIKASKIHSLALRSDGSVWAWGDNTYGQIGDGTSGTDRLVPTQVTGLTSGVIDIAVRDYSSFALKSDGTVWAWGYNNNGQLGVGSQIQKNVPNQVLGINGSGYLNLGISGTRSIATGAGGTHSMALKSDGSVVAWGNNALGQLGIGSKGNVSLFPVEVIAAVVDPNPKVIAISTRDSSSAALKSDGSVWSWGWNSDGQVGDGTQLEKDVPTQVIAAAVDPNQKVIAIATGYEHTIALKSDGTVLAWGYNSSGQLGNNTQTRSLSPIPINGITGVTSISAGGSHSMALKNDGSVVAWGNNTYGQVGDSSYNDNKLTPTQVIGLTSGSGVVSISAGGSHSMALKNDGSVVAWGVNGDGQIGDGSSGTNRLTQVRTLYNIPIGILEKSGGLSNVIIDTGINKRRKLYSVDWNSDSLPTNTSIKVSVRNSADGRMWSNWVQSTQSSLGSTTGTVDLSGLSSLRYIKIKVLLSTTSTTITPTLNDFSLVYLNDVTKPINPTTVVLYDGLTQINGKTQADFFNIAQPIFKFSGVIDPDSVNSVAVDQSGIKGYYVYFGQTSDATPLTAGAYQDHVNSVIDTFNSADLQTFMPSAFINEGTYYLRVSTDDIAGNISDPVTLFTYRYDKTPPTAVSSLTVNPFGWSSTNNFTFNWAASTDLSGQGQSRVLGYQYKINDSDDNWVDSSQTVSNQLILADSNKVVPGRNDLYIRAIDNAGNTSVTVQHIYFYYTGNAPSEPLALTVSPSFNSSSNSFTFSWLPPSKAAPGSYQGNIISYRYAVNQMVTKTNSVEVKISDIENDASVYDKATGRVTLTNIPAATRAVPDSNTIYIITIGTDGTNEIVAYGDEASMAKVDFSCDTSAPGLPTNVQLFDTSNRETSEYSVTMKWTAPSAENSGIGISGYDIYRSTDNINFGYPLNRIGESAGTSFIDSNVIAGTTYYYKVRSRDSVGSSNGPTTAISIVPSGRYTKAPDITDGPAVMAKVSTANIKWTTSTDDTLDQHKASSFVEIGETVIPDSKICSEVYGTSQGQDDHVSDHEVLVTGLKPDSTYYFRVKSTDKDGNKICSNGLFKTQPAPRVERVTIQDVRLYTAILTWYTSEPAESDLLYGKSTSYSNTLANVSGGLTTVHSVRLEGLEHSSTYHFAIKIKDIDKNEIMSDDYSFDTQQYPKLSNVRFQPMADQSTATFKVSWDSNVPTTSVVEFKPEGGKAQEAVKSKLDTKHEVLVTGLFDNTYYLINVVGVDQYGNRVVSDVNRVKTDFDTRPPTASGVAVEVSNTEFGTAAKSQVVVSWETDEPATSQVEYDFGVTGEEFSIKSQEDAVLTTSHVVVITGLRPSSSYHLRAVSRDASGNKGISEPQSILTEQARSSVLDMIISSIQSSLGWLFGMGD